MGERQQSILGAVIEAYIRTARPVASREIAQSKDFGLSPATIRNEFLRLDEEGYVVQPHRSAGRVPTDRGYRFFADHLTRSGALSAREREILGDALGESEAELCVKALSRAISRISGTFAAAGLTDEDLFYETGFAELLEEPEFEDQKRLRAFGRMADEMDEEIRFLLRDIGSDEDGARMYIGSENPWPAARDCTMTIVRWEHTAGFRGFVGMIGPTRTDYGKHKAIIRFLHG